MELKYVSDEVWMWIHKKYVMSRIVQKLSSFRTNNFTYLALTNNDRVNQQTMKLITCNSKTVKYWQILQ